MAGHTLEYIEDGHIYLVDGVIVPSVTEMLKSKFGHKYDFVNEAVLNRAASAGTAVHEAIERYCKTGEETDIPELRGFKFLQRMYGFKVLENEVPVILFDNDEPIAAGRLDMVLEMNGKIGGADIKRTSALDKEYLAYQLNMYRIAYRQSYGTEWKFLRGIHLREEKRKFIAIPICEDLTMEFIKNWRANDETC
ncbi:MAG: hypothetical protein II702_06675 [Clostridia bacterium]|nr:hypothetical protein [Clostridia bacterium]